jgi:hypothetical protein
MKILTRWRVKILRIERLSRKRIILRSTGWYFPGKKLIQQNKKEVKWRIKRKMRILNRLR